MNIIIPGSGKTLTLCEVEVYGAKDGMNGNVMLVLINGFVPSIPKKYRQFKLIQLFIFLLGCHERNGTFRDQGGKNYTHQPSRNRHINRFQAYLKGNNLSVFVSN